MELSCCSIELRFQQLSPIDDDVRLRITGAAALRPLRLCVLRDEPPQHIEAVLTSCVETVRCPSFAGPGGVREHVVMRIHNQRDSNLRSSVAEHLGMILSRQAMDELAPSL